VVALNETVRRGDCGDTVLFIQQRLTVLGFPVTADGRFGPGTEQAVKDFQTARGLTADGVVGTTTWAALVEGGIGD
jgi:peptidoglycan hydrolase-like protein with peptidoglycan-binding domain